MKISVIGLGKLGAPLAAVFASKGFRVVGTDVNPAFVDAVNAGRAPADEPRLQELIDENRTRLLATRDAASAVADSDVTFVIVPRRAMRRVDSAIASSARRWRVSVKVFATVMPGSTGGEIRAALEAHARRHVGDRMGVCYNPEFIALDSVVRDMLSPDMILIRQFDAKAGDVLESIYDKSGKDAPRSVSRIFASWNQTDRWLGQLDRLWLVASWPGAE